MTSIRFSKILKKLLSDIKDWHYPAEAARKSYADMLKNVYGINIESERFYLYFTTDLTFMLCKTEKDEAKLIIRHGEIFECSPEDFEVASDVERLFLLVDSEFYNSSPTIEDAVDEFLSE